MTVTAVRVGNTHVQTNGNEVVVRIPAEEMAVVLNALYVAEHNSEVRDKVAPRAVNRQALSRVRDRLRNAARAQLAPTEETA